MEFNETELVHRVTIARFASPGRVPIYTALCRLCKMVIEQKTVPLSIKTRGLVAVRRAGMTVLKFWSVSEPLSSDMKMCSPEEYASYSVAALQALFDRTASEFEIPRNREPVVSLSIPLEPVHIEAKVRGSHGKKAASSLTTILDMRRPIVLRAK